MFKLMKQSIRLLRLRSLVSLSYPILASAKNLLNQVGYNRPELRVLLYHDVAPSEMDSFAATLRHLMNKWDFLTPAQFEKVMQGEIRISKDSLLLTFDDGFLSNRAVADEILSPLGIKAIFFVILDFISQPNVSASRQFICDKLKVAKGPEFLPKHLLNLDWRDVEYLLKLGHTIGAHSKSHERLNPPLTPTVMRDEIINSADILESKLSIRISHFAFPFGSFESFNEPAMELALSRFNFVHSGLRGNNLLERKNFVIRRESFKASDSQSLIGGFLCGASDWRYRRYLNILDKWASKG